jgi:hypothetical protein
MLNSAVLDLAIGLIFCFLSVGLATGAIVEAIASLFAIRAMTLWKGIGQLLNDPTYVGLAKEIYAHAAINPRSSGTDSSNSKWNRKNPAYIDRQLFGQAMLDILKISTQVAASANNPNAPGAKPSVDALKETVDNTLAVASAAQGKRTPDDQLQKFLHGIIERSLGDPDKIKGELVAWFDNAMDRISGWYKRWTQLIGFIVALIMATGLNIDTVKVAEALWTQPKLAQDLIKNSPLGDAATPSPAGITASGESTTSKEESTVVMLRRLDTTLPVGWPYGIWHNQNGKLDFSGFGIALVGWLITALSTLFGAPFWFDLLQTVIRLKGAGPSPKEKVDGSGASA